MLLGFSALSPIKGDAALEVRLATLDKDSEHDLRFRDIYFLNRFESDWSNGSDRWFRTRDIDCKVTVTGNEFRNVLDDAYEQGLVQGAFLGLQHEMLRGGGKGEQEDQGCDETAHDGLLVRIKKNPASAKRQRRGEKREGHGMPFPITHDGYRFSAPKPPTIFPELPYSAWKMPVTTFGTPSSPVSYIWACHRPRPPSLSVLSAVTPPMVHVV